ncbi:MAG: glycosyltransferase [Bacteroidetes bacterium]|jgi:GT2 family glycosyltransferase|nr:glycosyltransferase [Bacteroidota bacterium]
MIKIAIVILNWNGKSYLEKFLPSVISNSDMPGVSVIVADNASTDDSVRFLQSNFPTVRIIELDNNYGYAGGYARSLKQIEAEYFVLLNSDIEVTDGWLKPIVKFMDGHPKVAACMPKIKAYNQKNSFEYAGAAGGYIDKYGYPFCRGRILKTIETDQGQYNNKSYIFWASGACMFVRSSAYFEIGGLDEDFFVHMEEIDVCWRLQNKGYHIVVIPSVEVFHVGGGTLPNNNPRKLYYNYRNSLYMLYKNLPDKKFRRTILQRILLDYVSSVFYLLQFSGSFFVAVLKAHYHFYKNLKTLRHKRRQWKHPISEFPKSVYQSSILINFFLKKKRKFSQISLLNLQELIDRTV